MSKLLGGDVQKAYKKVVDTVICRDNRERRANVSGYTVKDAIPTHYELGRLIAISENHD